MTDHKLAVLALLCVTFMFGERAHAYDITVTPQTVSGGNFATLGLFCTPGVTVYLNADPPIISVPSSVTMPPFFPIYTTAVSTEVVPVDTEVTLTAGDAPGPEGTRLT